MNLKIVIPIVLVLIISGTIIISEYNPEKPNIENNNNQIQIKTSTENGNKEIQIIDTTNNSNDNIINQNLNDEIITTPQTDEVIKNIEKADLLNIETTNEESTATHQTNTKNENENSLNPDSKFNQEPLSTDLNKGDETFSLE